MKRRITTLTLVAKCSDQCSVAARGVGHGVLAENNGYVPGFMPGEHYGDYVQLEIDVATGRILNWKPPSDATILRDIRGM